MGPYFKRSPLPLGWSGWVEGFCSYILGGRWKWPPKGSTKSVFLQNPPTSWTRTSLQNHSTQPHFLGALSPKSHSTKSQLFKTSISVIFSPLDFERVKKNKSDFVEKTPWQRHVRYTFLRIDFPSYSYLPKTTPITFAII